MTLATIDAYSISVFLHVSAVVVGFGSTFAEAVLFPVALQSGTRHLPYLHRVQLAINTRFANPALALIIITGIYQVIDAELEFSAFWISATFLIAIVLGGLNGAYFVPTDKRLAAMAEREIEAGGGGDVAMSEDYLAQARREGMIGALAGLLVIVAIFLMVTKPGA